MTIVVDPAPTKIGYHCVVGRNAALCTEHIDDLRVSSTHFAIELRGKHIVLADMSTNGTFVNNMKVGKNKTTEIKPGDRITILKGENLAPHDHIWYDLSEEAEGPDQKPKQNVSGMAGGTVPDADVSMGGVDVSMDKEKPPVALEKDKQKRFANALARVRSEMEVSRRTKDIVTKLDRRFDTSELDQYLQTAARHILTAFTHIKRWVSQHVELFAAAFLIKPLSNNLLETMSKLEGELLREGPEEQLWREHAQRLDEIELEQVGRVLYTTASKQSTHSMSKTAQNETRRTGIYVLSRSPWHFSCNPVVVHRTSFKGGCWNRIRRIVVSSRWGRGHDTSHDFCPHAHIELSWTCNGWCKFHFIFSISRTKLRRRWGCSACIRGTSCGEGLASVCSGSDWCLITEVSEYIRTRTLRAALCEIR